MKAVYMALNGLRQGYSLAFLRIFPHSPYSRSHDWNFYLKELSHHKISFATPPELMVLFQEIFQQFPRRRCRGKCAFSHSLFHFF